jgi:hypothetical protein
MKIFIYMNIIYIKKDLFIFLLRVKKINMTFKIYIKLFLEI